MELEWDSRPSQHRAEPRAHWHEHQQQPPPVSFSSQQNASLNQRRRSSAASVRPAGPPPNLPIPSLPGSTHNVVTYPSISSSSDINNMYSSSPNSISRGTRLPSNSFSRPLASPNLSAIAAFSQARQSATSATNGTDMLSSPPSMDDLSDPPPQSYFTTSSTTSVSRNGSDPPDRNLLAPPSEHTPRTEHRPSSRRALTRALELARQAVQLDSTNDNPEAAVQAYAQSVALLSEVMERVRSYEDSTTDSHRRRRRRSVAAQEEDVRRMQNIHDTYVDRMNILSIIYSIPAVPYPSTSTFSVSADSTTSNSPTASAAPSSTGSFGGVGNTHRDGVPYHQHDEPATPEMERLVFGSPRDVAAQPGREGEAGPAMFTNAHHNAIYGGTFQNVVNVYEYASPAQGGGPAFPIMMFGLQAVSFATRSHYPHINHPFNVAPLLIPEPTSTSSLAIYLPFAYQEMRTAIGPLALWLLIKMWIQRRSIEH